LQNGQLLRQIEGTGEPPPTIDWNINDGKNRERLVVAPVSYSFSLTDADGQTTTTEPQTLEFKESVTVREIQRRREEYSVMCFNYDETNLAASNAGQLNLIRARLPRNAGFSVIGTTDTLGSESYNRELSLRRARVISRSLGLGSNSKISGIGEDATTFDNGTAEGRFYSRRVRIIVDYERQGNSR
jgi:outer membrane protein OmpA-like peptidoglycan-associated protein